MYVSQLSRLVAFARHVGFPSLLSRPLYDSVTILESTSPVKLPARHCLPARFLWGKGIRVANLKERCSIDVPPCGGSPSYARQSKSASQCQATVKLHGVFLSMCK